jgi:hypothetical protein
MQLDASLIDTSTMVLGRSQWPCGLTRASAADRLLRFVGSNSTGDMHVCLLWMLCVVRKRSLLRADHSSRGVLPNVARRCVWSRNLVNEEALAQWGLPRQYKLSYWILSPQTPKLIEANVWNVTSCNLLQGHQRFGENCCVVLLNLLDQINAQY